MAHIRKMQPLTKSVYDLACERVAHAFDHFDTVVVSFSGGKDSTACLNIALAEARRRGKLPLRVVHFDEEACPYETEDYVRRVAQTPDVALEWYCVPIKYMNACSRKYPYWSPWALEDRERWVRPLPPEAITSFPGYEHPPMEQRLNIPDMIGLLNDPAKYGTVGIIMGIRAQESITRTRAVRMRNFENYIIHDVGATTQGNIWKVYPVYDWLTEDIWTAPAQFGWDYNRAYDAMDKAGIPPSSQRVCTPFGAEPLRGLWLFRECFPDVWDRMSLRVPGVTTAMRYARTDVYGYGGTMDKPDHLTWEQVIVHYLDKWAPAERQAWAERIGQELRTHYGKTLDPIVADTPHPLTGLNWRFLLMLAMRGDQKNRRIAAKQTDGKDRLKLRQRYEEEREAMYGPRALPLADPLVGNAPLALDVPTVVTFSEPVEVAS